MMVWLSRIHIGVVTDQGREHILCRRGGGVDVDVRCLQVRTGGSGPPEKISLPKKVFVGQKNKFKKCLQVRTGGSEGG